MRPLPTRDNQTIAILIGGGGLERHPTLRCIFLEANGGSIASFLERLDHHYEIFGWDVPALKMKPSEYFRRQCWISFDPDESLLKITAEHPLVGADRIIWASDYSASRRQNPRRRRRVARSQGRLERRQAGAHLRPQRRRALQPAGGVAVGRVINCHGAGPRTASPSTAPRWCG
jgi:hypothetical protein